MATKFNTVVTSTATNDQITAVGNDALITKDYADANYSGGGGGGGTAYYLQAIGSGTQNTSQGSANAITVDLDTSQLTSSASHFTVGATGEITVANAGKYFIAYSIDSDQTSGNNRVIVTGLLEVDSSGSFAEVAGSRGHDYSRNTNTEEATIYGSSIVSLSAGDKVRVRAFQDVATTNVQARINGSNSHISIHSLAASVGATGVSSATDNTANVSTIDLTKIAGTYYTSTSNTASYTVATGAVAGGFAHITINKSGNAPTFTNATKLTGADFVESTDMKMIVYNDGVENLFYFLEE